MGFFTQHIKTARVNLPRDTSAKLKPFSSAKPEHLEIIDARVARFNETLLAIQTVDAGIRLGLKLAGTILGLYVPLIHQIIPFTFSINLALAIIGWSIVFYGLARRFDYKYFQALDDLKEAYRWAMGTKTDDYWFSLREKSIQDMILSLGPWVTETTIHTWTPDDLVEESMLPKMVREAGGGRKVKELTPEFKEQLADLTTGVHTSTSLYRIYGETGIGDISILLQNYLERVKGVYNQGITFFKQAQVFVPGVNAVVSAATPK